MKARVLAAMLVLVLLLGFAAEALAQSNIVVPSPPSAPAEAGQGQQRLIEILQRVINFLMLIAALVTTVMLIVHGYHVITAIDGRQKAEAMQGIYRTLLGAAVVFGSAIITRVMLSVVLG
jgi:uncharacterized membrane protein